jgi:hypothetical protein
LSGQERLSRADAVPSQDKEILRLEHDALVAAQNGEPLHNPKQPFEKRNTKKSAERVGRISEDE